MDEVRGAMWRYPGVVAVFSDADGDGRTGTLRVSAAVFKDFEEAIHCLIRTDAYKRGRLVPVVTYYRPPRR